jgi:hypothetical protein
MLNYRPNGRGSPGKPSIKADSHIACRALAVPLPCLSLIDEAGASLSRPNS